MPLQTILSMMCSQIYGGIGNKAALRLLTLKGTPVSLQGTCSGLILTDLTPLASTSLVPPDMLSYTVYLGAFWNLSTPGLVLAPLLAFIAFTAFTTAAALVILAVSCTGDPSCFNCTVVIHST